MNKIKNKKGITLVALIITVVVIVILSAITINIIFKNNFIEIATKGIENYAEGQVEEERMMNNLSEFLEEIVGNITTAGEKQLAEELTFKEKEIILEPKQNKKLEIEVNPYNTTNTKLNWTSSDETVATVKDGNVTAIKEGTATITATTIDGSNLMATCTIIVKKLLFSEKTGYVSDGLILHYDAIQNTREGHNSQATVWEDLSGNSKDSTLKGGIWAGNSLILNGSNEGVYIENKLSDLFKADNTIEIRVQFYEDGRDIIIGNYSVSNNINYEKYSNKQCRIYFNNGKLSEYSNSNTLNIGNFQTLTYVMNKKDGRIEIYKDSNKIDSATVESSHITNYNSDWNSVWIGKDSRTGSTCLKGEIRSVRVYNRILSSEEIIKNNQIDEERFVEKEMTVQEAKEQINSSNFKDFIGKQVDYQPEKEGTWRIFYYDVEGSFSQPNSIILKRDVSWEDTIKPDEHYNYESEANIVERMKKADPAWERSSYSSSVNSNAERFLAWCCDPTNWTKYYNSSNSEFISCIPSLDLYITSLSMVMNGIEKVNWTSDTTCRYGNSTHNVLLGKIPVSYNGVYTANATNYIFCSPSSYSSNYFWICDFVAEQRGQLNGLYAATGSVSFPVCPIVYLK